jgi:hypothetical protein
LFDGFTGSLQNSVFFSFKIVSLELKVKEDWIDIKWFLYWGDVNDKLSRLCELSKCIHPVKEFISCYIQKKYVNGAEKRHKI